MRNINLTILALILLIPAVSFGQDRNVVWLHGLGGNGVVWNAMEGIFDNEREMSLGDQSPGYQSMNGVGAASNEVVTTMENTLGFAGSRANDNIGIGHSMGGVVLRNIDNTETGADQRFGGVITVGSPNDGAIISNNVDNGMVGNATTHACGELLAGPSSEIPFVSIVIQGIIPEVICEVLNDELIEGLLDDQANNPSAVDLRVGSNVMNGINAGGSGIPQLSIWGNERSPVHWRLLSSFDTDNTNEVLWVNRAQNFRSVYNGFFIANTSASVVTGIFGFFNPAIWAITAQKAFSAAQWKRGVNWFDNSETIWNGLIGCGEGAVQTVTVTVEVNVYEYCDPCQYTRPQWWACIQEYCGGDPANCITVETETITQQVLANGRSDGFICMDAQIIDGTPPDDHYRADEANHSEETEPFSDVQLELRRIFEDRPAGDFFLTPER